jgi:hypothetical protein
MTRRRPAPTCSSPPRRSMPSKAETTEHRFSAMSR